MMKRWIAFCLFAFSAVGAFALPPIAGKYPIAASAGGGAAFECGSNIVRLTPYFGLFAGTEVPVPGGSIDISLGASAGSLVGSVVAAEADALFAFAFSGAWAPRVGAAFSVDWGDYVFASGSVVPLPPYPLAFAGLRIDPLRFKAGSGRFSALSMTGQIGLDGSWKTARCLLELFRLEWRL